jgi:hypothetical protein
MLRTYHASTVMLNATWQPILKSAFAKLWKFALRADFDASLKQVFGVEIESTELKQAWLAGNFGTLPKLEVLLLRKAIAAQKMLTLFSAFLTPALKPSALITKPLMMMPQPLIMIM